MKPVIQKKGRDSNMELLRIVAMFFVVLVHTTLLSTGIPNAEDFSSDFMVTFTRVSVTGTTAVCVNLFILISGWYAIRPKREKLAELIFQLIFFVAVSLIYGFVKQGGLSIPEVLRTIRLHNMWWFVKSYILLYFLAPVLNAFCERATKREFATVLIALYVFSSVNWLVHFVDWMANGYCTMSFMGLYLLARFIKLHLQNFVAMISKWWMAFIYILFSFLTITLFCVQTLFDILPIWNKDVFGYDSPFIVVASLSLLLFFFKLSIKSKPINWIATSCFAVYLFHTSDYIFPDFRNHLNRFYTTHDYWVYFLYSIVFSVLVYGVGILLDKVRIGLYGTIVNQKYIKFF